MSQPPPEPDSPEPDSPEPDAPVPAPPGVAPDAPYAPPGVAPAYAPTPAPRTPWRRLDRRMLLVHPVNEAIRFLPVLLGIVVVGRAAGGWQLAGLAVPVVWGLWRFFTTSFRVTESQVELRRGLVSQKVLTARLDRVRTVELSSSLIHRALGLAKVRIGTGTSGGGEGDGFELDALTAAEAATLRSQLLRVAAPATAGGGPGKGMAVNTAGGTDDSGPAPGAPEEVTLLELDPRWARYAPFTSSGAVAAAGLLAVGGQLVDALAPDLTDLALVRRLEDVPVAPAVAAGLVVLFALGAALGVVGYLVGNWGFTLSRRTDGTSLRVRRGLLTTTETTLETARVRGVTLVEPLGLRVLGAARTKAMVVGGQLTSGGTTTVAPNCPRGVATGTAARVLGSPAPFDAALRRHGPVARRRRYVRALAPLAVLAALLVVPVALDRLPAWVPALPLALVPVMVLVARDRYRRLGHALVEDHLVVREGTFSGRHVALDLEGVIGWHVTQSLFQRRQGIATLVATTAAGAQSYAVPDLPEHDATALALAADPHLVGQFVG